MVETQNNPLEWSLPVPWSQHGCMAVQVVWELNDTSTDRQHTAILFRPNYVTKLAHLASQAR